MEEKESVESVINKVFRRFEQMDDQQTHWTSLDTNMSMLAWLDDNQLVKETEIVYSGHYLKNIKCKMDHEQSKCFAPIIVEAVGYILDLCNDSGNLSANNRYVLEYYISLAKIGEIKISEA